MHYSVRTLLMATSLIAVAVAALSWRLSTEHRSASHEAAVAEALGRAGVIVLTEPAPWTLLRYDQIAMVDTGDLNAEASLGDSALARAAILCGDADVQLLTGCRGVSVVRLANSQITDRAVKALAALGTLTEVDLGGTNITDACVADLARLPEHCQLTLVHTRITPTARQRLRELRPDLVLSREP